jgi:hypothetical protein
LPALNEITENIPLEDIAMVFFKSKKKADKIQIPQQTDEERKKAFNDLEEKVKEWRLKNG